MDDGGGALIGFAGELAAGQDIATPETSTKLGAKGIGEAGLIGAMGSVWVAVNDALKPFGAKILHQPFTPERVLDSLARARASRSAPTGL
jgi:CO/xanthine dehydrogenase Mo-binding subunit